MCYAINLYEPNDHKNQQEGRINYPKAGGEKPSMTYLLYLLGVFELSFVSYSVVGLKEGTQHRHFYFECLSHYLTFHLHILSTLLNCLKLQSSQAVHKLSHKVIGFQSLNIHSSIKLFTEMFVLAVEIFAYL